jgi:2-oxoglutarate ferredoxin oxidoreductase subunit gamma
LAPPFTEADCDYSVQQAVARQIRKFLKPGGKLFVNSSLIDKKPSRSDIEVYYVPVNEAAMKLGNVKVINLIMLGAFVAATGLVKKDSVMKAVAKTFGEHKANLIAIK